MSIWTMLGGPVFWLLIVLGVTSVLLFFNRLIALRRAQIASASSALPCSSTLPTPRTKSA